MSSYGMFPQTGLVAGKVYVQVRTPPPPTQISRQLPFEPCSYQQTFPSWSM